MPIDIDEFEAAPPEALQTATEASPTEHILEFLAFNPKKAYSREEIQTATGITGLDLIQALSNLENQGYVTHKGSYWIIDPDADVSVDDGTPWEAP